MKRIIDGKFYSPSKGNLSFSQMIEEIFSYVNEKPDQSYEVILGCDSSSEEEPSFPIAVVVLRKGQGGRFFLKKIKYKGRKFHTLHERILEEVMLSCKLALVLRDELKERARQFPDINYRFKYIHADIGENGATKDMIKEVIGLINGNGFEAKIKPESYVASIVADRYT